jgi:hypothetical protein
MAPMFTGLRTMAIAAGRDPTTCAGGAREPAPHRASPWGRIGDLHRLARPDCRRHRRYPARWRRRTLLDLTFSPGIATLDGLLAGMERLRELALAPATPARAR